MRPKTKQPESGKLFEHELDGVINMDHPLVKLAELIDWSEFEQSWSDLFPSKRADRRHPPG